MSRFGFGNTPHLDNWESGWNQHDDGPIPEIQFWKSAFSEMNPELNKIIFFGMLPGDIDVYQERLDKWYFDALEGTFYRDAPSWSEPPLIPKVYALAWGYFPSSELKAVFVHLKEEGGFQPMVSEPNSTRVIWTGPYYSPEQDGGDITLDLDEGEDSDEGGWTDPMDLGEGFPRAVSGYED